MSARPYSKASNIRANSPAQQHQMLSSQATKLQMDMKPTETKALGTLNHSAPKILGKNKKGMSIHLYPRIYLDANPRYPHAPFLSSEEKDKAKYIIAMGQTGTGKTTLLNALTNYLMEVRKEDEFRYHLVEEDLNSTQTQSITSEVNTYAIRPKNKQHPPLVIIDTPGYGDSKGIDKDKEIDNMLMELFTKKVDRIHLICFVAKASSNRLTSVESYIFTKVLNMFGKDVAENFLFMLTFSDGGEPQFKESLQDGSSMVAKIIPTIKEPWALEFNNSVVFQKLDSKNKLVSYYWDIYEESMKQFLEKLKNIKAKSLIRTREVISQRKHLDLVLHSLQTELTRLISVKGMIEDMMEKYKTFVDKMDASKDYMIPYQEPFFVKHPRPTNCTTLCMTCTYTCHKECGLAPGDSKELCSSMEGNYCGTCPKRCHYSSHINTDHIIEWKTRTAYKSSKELEENYFNAKSSKSKAEQVLDGLAGDIEVILIKCVQYQEDIKNCINKLNEIALHNGSFKTLNDYLDMLISNESHLMESGWKSRVENLRAMRKKNDELEKAVNNQTYKTKSKSEIIKEILPGKKSWWEFWK